jgi:hypothetical protein
MDKIIASVIFFFDRWRHILKQCVRIKRDGGKIVSVRRMSRRIHDFQKVGLWGKRKLFTDPNIAVKKDSNGHVTKVYDFSGKSYVEFNPPIEWRKL